MPKRTAQVKVHLTPEIREQLELFKAEEPNGNVLSMSTYLFGVLAEHVAMKAVRIQISKQKLGRRAGQQ